MKNDLSEQKIIEIIKELPIFQDILKQHENREQLQLKRVDAIRTRREILANWEDFCSEEKKIVADADEELKKIQLAMESISKRRGAAQNIIITKDYQRRQSLEASTYILWQSAPTELLGQLDTLKKQLETAKNRPVTSSPDIESGVRFAKGSAKNRLAELNEKNAAIVSLQSEIKIVTDKILNNGGV